MSVLLTESLEMLPECFHILHLDILFHLLHKGIIIELDNTRSLALHVRIKYMNLRMVEFVLHQHFEFFHLICHFGQITDIRGYRYVTVSIIIGFDDLYDLICLTENIHLIP